jgi:dTDP-4-amino-4,6-dideoxygalactose transaminase
MDAGHVYHLFAVLAHDRDILQRQLLAGGVETLVHYPIPLPRQPAFASEDPAQCPIADRLCDQVLSLPLYPGLSPAAVEQVAAAAATPLQPAKGE